MVTQPLSFPSTAFGGSVSKEADLAVHLQDSGREEFFEYCARSVFGLSAKRISTIRPGNEPHARSITMSGIFEHLPFIADPLDIPELFKLVEKRQDILLT
jgi:hypothetical protein